MTDRPRAYASVLHDTTVRFADDFEQMAELPSGAFRVHLEALMWCTLSGLPLRVEKVHVSEFAQSEDPAPAVAELVLSGWWVEDGEHWDIGGRHAETFAEEAEDIADAEIALAAYRAGAPTIPHEQVWAELGLATEEGERLE